MPKTKRKPAAMNLPSALTLAPREHPHARPAERVRDLEELKAHPSGRARTLVRITPEMRVLADEMREPGETLSGFFLRLMAAEARRQYKLDAAALRAIRAAKS